MATTPYKFSQVDAFTEKPFGGNPAAVLVLSKDDPLTQNDDVMLKIAQEMNLAETAYVRKLDDGTFGLRWFTPTLEVNLCGHATLASSHVLYEEGHLSSDKEARFQTRSGLLVARKVGDLIELNFPSYPPKPTAEVPGLFESLGVDPSTVKFMGIGGEDYFIVVNAEAVVHALNPNYSRLKEFDIRGVMVTAQSEPTKDYHFVSRWFGPQTGMDEDPVTGSAHCSLAPYWCEVLGKNEMNALQASARTGRLKVILDDGPKSTRVRILGSAVTVIKGTLFI